jgi:hypothetical protein
MPAPPAGFGPVSRFSARGAYISGARCAGGAGQRSTVMTPSTLARLVSMKVSTRTIALVTLALGLSGLVAWAQIGAGGTVLGCVGNSGIIRGVDETTGSCRSGDTPLSWYTKAGADAAFAALNHNHDGRYYTKADSDGRYVLQGTSSPRADGPCFDNTNRYVNCSNGTVTDTATGLIWLRLSACLPSTNWAAANEAAAGLKDGDCGLTDKSSPGDWRLATRDEWLATMARAVALGCLGTELTQDAGTACFGNGSGSSFVGAGGAYWSSSADMAFPSGTAIVNMANGSVAQVVLKTSPFFQVWPVRSGSR